MKKSKASLKKETDAFCPKCDTCCRIWGPHKVALDTVVVLVYNVAKEMSNYENQTNTPLD